MGFRSRAAQLTGLAIITPVFFAGAAATAAPTTVPTTSSVTQQVDADPPAPTVITVDTSDIAAADSTSDSTSTAGTTTTKVVAKTAPINRCGDKYTWKSAAQRLFTDYHKPAIQKYRIRLIPGTHRVCVEFLKRNPDFKTQSHMVTFRDTAKSAADAIWGGLWGKYKSDDRKVFADVELQARRADHPNGKWHTKAGGVVLVIIM